MYVKKLYSKLQMLLNSPLRTRSLILVAGCQGHSPYKWAPCVASGHAAGHQARVEGSDHRIGPDGGDRGHVQNPTHRSPAIPSGFPDRGGTRTTCAN